MALLSRGTDVALDNRPDYRSAYKALHHPLTVCGVDRRLFFLVLLVGAATFNLFYSLVAGCLIGGLLYGAAWWSATHDPQMLRILLRSSTSRVRYDAARYTPSRVTTRFPA
jgi:type IV secretory pathway TrbD component